MLGLQSTQKSQPVFDRCVFYLLHLFHARVHATFALDWRVFDRVHPGAKLAAAGFSEAPNLLQAQDERFEPWPILYHRQHGSDFATRAFSDNQECSDSSLWLVI